MNLKNRHYPREHYLNIHPDGPGPFALGITIHQFGKDAHIALTPEQAERLAEEISVITESRVDKAERRRKNTSCSFCRPNRGENAKRKPKHGRK